jgi:hypothetical protein
LSPVAETSKLVFQIYFLIWLDVKIKTFLNFPFVPKISNVMNESVMWYLHGLFTKSPQVWSLAYFPHQQFSKCGTKMSRGIPWVLVRNANSWALLHLLIQKLPGGPSNFCFNIPSGWFWYPFSLRTTAPLLNAENEL